VINGKSSDNLPICHKLSMFINTLRFIVILLIIFFVLLFGILSFILIMDAEILLGFLLLLLSALFLLYLYKRSGFVNRIVNYPSKFLSSNQIYVTLILLTILYIVWSFGSMCRTSVGVFERCIGGIVIPESQRMLLTQIVLLLILLTVIIPLLDFKQIILDWRKLVIRIFEYKYFSQIMFVMITILLIFLFLYK